MVKHARDTALLSGVIYFFQGALGISGIALPLYLRGLGWSITEITTISSLAALPWVLKIFYGFLSDTRPLFGYRRKSYLILFSICTAFGWFALALLPTTKMAVFTAIMFTNLGFAATDVITDGYVVEHSAGVASSVYQSIAWGSRSAGSVFGGILSGWLAANWKSHHVFYLTFCLPLCICVCALFIRERKIEDISDAVRHPIRSCAHLLTQSNIRLYALILFFVSISASFGVPFFFHMKETLGFPETFLGMLSSLGWGGAGIGSIIYMRWLRQIPPQKTLRWAMIFNCINILSTLLIKDEKSAFIVVFLGGAMGCLVMLPIASSIASATHHSGVEGTLFAILMSVFNIGQISFGFIGGKLFNEIGLVPLILVSGATALLGLFFIRKLQWETPPS